MTGIIHRDIRDMAKSIVERGIYRYQSEIVRDSVRQLAFRYALNAGSLDEVREIVHKASKKSEESLSQAVMKMREEAA